MNTPLTLDPRSAALARHALVMLRGALRLRLAILDDDEFVTNDIKEVCEDFEQCGRLLTELGWDDETIVLADRELAKLGEVKS